ncbi:MAG: EamA family transporter RarD [Proteobacteria bacterium]|nr:EamA family transporter RarD [Pseudomonadota bacterium]
MTESAKATASRSGAIYAAAAYATWGFVPLFWRELRHVPPVQILAHRILWSLAFFFIIFTVRKQLRGWMTFASGLETVKKCIPSGIAIGINWGLYIYAVNSGHALESSLGYFINPIFNVLIGSFFFKEVLRPLQWTAFAFACAGVLLMTAAAGKLPWIALSLAGTFSAYGVLRKKSELKGTSGTALESLLLFPAALAILLHPELAPFSVLQGPADVQAVKTLLLLAAGGALTALPLVWFAEAAMRLPMTTLGFYQYISPTFQFLIAVFVFREPFDSGKLVAFLFIWTGLFIFAADSVRRSGQTVLK